MIELTNRIQFAKTSGIVLDRDLLSVYQMIEIYSVKGNVAKSALFHYDRDKIESSGLTHERFRTALASLIDFKLVGQVFEVTYDRESKVLDLEIYYFVETDSLRDPNFIYTTMVEKSSKSIFEFCKETKRANPKEMGIIAFNLGSGNLKAWGETFYSLFAKGKFLILPDDDFLKQFISDLKSELDHYNNLIGSLDQSFYFVPEDNARDIFLQFSIVLESKLIPALAAKSPEISQKIKDLEANEDIQKKSPDYSGDWEYLRNLATLAMDSGKLISESGKILANTVIKLSVEAESYQKKQEKQVKDKQFLNLVKALDSGEDLDSLFLRVNIEDYSSIPRSILDMLRVDREILSAEFFTSSSKLQLFAIKKPANLKKINQIIYNQYRFDTDYILFFRNLLESNEKDVYEVFQDKEFVKLYGKSLQEAYLRYIPFIYKIFAFLGIQFLINAGYAKAKSIIKFKQMERQFQFEKRQEKQYKERLEARKLEIQKELLTKYKMFLLSGMEESISLLKKIPSVGEISLEIPALSPAVIDQLVSEFSFRLTTKGQAGQDTLLLFPLEPGYEEKNREFKYLVDDILADRIQSDEIQKSRAKLLKEFFN
jgi:hypothetical protein